MQSRHLHNCLQQEARCALTSIFFFSHQGILKDSINCHLQTIIIYSESPDANEPPNTSPELSAHSLTSRAPDTLETRKASDWLGRGRSIWWGGASRRYFQCQWVREKSVYDLSGVKRRERKEMGRTCLCLEMAAKWTLGRQAGSPEALGAPPQHRLPTCSVGHCSKLNHTLL